MIIRISNGTSTQTLCDGPDRSVDKSAGPDGYSVSAETMGDPADFLRATTAVEYDRGNLLHVVTWRVYRQLATPELAGDYATTHPQDVLRVHTLQVVTTTGTKSFTAGRLSRCFCRHTGATVIIDYEFRGGLRT